MFPDVVPGSVVTGLHGMQAFASRMDNCRRVDCPKSRVKKCQPIDEQMLKLPLEKMTVRERLESRLAAAAGREENHDAWK